MNCGVEVCARNDLGVPLCQSGESLTHALCTAVSYVSPILSLGFGSHVGGELSKTLGARILAKAMCFYGDNHFEND